MGSNHQWARRIITSKEHTKQQFGNALLLILFTGNDQEEDGELSQDLMDTHLSLGAWFFQGTWPPASQVK